MSNDKIEEIRARHKAVTWCFYETKSQIHDDREVLLAEVERLHAELRAMTAGFEVAYHALGAKP